MIVDERMIDYIHSLDRGYSPLISEIRQEALRNRVPVIRQETATFLRVLLTMTKPKKILEVGTAVGFSALLMSECIDSDATITTIENYDKRIPIAMENFKKAGKQSVITLMEGDAAEVMKTLEPGYDFIFMDAAKAQYIHFLPEVMRLLKVGGTLVSDNVLQDGDMTQSRYAVTRRNRTIHHRMRAYLWTLTHSDCLETSVLPIGDGVSVSSKVSDTALSFLPSDKE